MDVKILPGSLSGTVKAIPSKSQAHRALICAALSGAASLDGPTYIECDSDSDDIKATAACLSALGADIKYENGSYIVQPLKQTQPKHDVQNDTAAILHCGESGSTFRFLLPIAGALGKKVSFTLDGRLPQRPLSPLYEELVRHGCVLSPQGANPFCIEGKLTPGIYSLDAGVSSQFISGLLFALPLLDRDSELRLTGKIESFPYIELTMSMLETFGIKAEFKGMIFSIPGRQTYRSSGKVHIEGDWSNAAFWLTAGALGKSSITCEGLDLQSRQGDRAITDILAQFGAQIKKSGSSVTVFGGKLQGIEIDALNIPDLVPALAVAASAANGSTVIRNAERLRIKESDRLAAISSVLNELGADVRVTEDGLIINGGVSLAGGQVSSWGDHRIAMAAAVASILCARPVRIHAAEAVNKSYPRFFDDFRMMGGLAEEASMSRKTFGLLGEKLKHSFSPMIHEYLGDYKYPLYEITSDDLYVFMTESRFDGINVTIPYKQAVMPYCASLSDEARSIGSVNTIIKDKDGLLHGHNTDYHGFCVMLEQSGIDPNGKKVLVLGDGGSARTVRAALSGLGAREIVTISRRGENNYGNISLHHDAQILVNTTPVGMYPDNGNSPLSLEGFKQLTGVVDLIYNPMRTKLLLEAERMGIPCVNGLIMLAAQAETASRLFLDISARAELVIKIVNAIMKKTQNIALIGMPGCGKSTAGKNLAHAMKRPLADIDELIAAAAGKSIPQIFAEDGEEAFRRIETRILGEEAAKSGMVIATGGGIVTKAENFDLLRQNSLIVYLKRELTELVTTDRPLSGSIGIETLAKQRLPLYEAWSDHIVQVGASPELTVMQILKAIE